MSQEGGVKKLISRKKICYPVGAGLRRYLKYYRRSVALSLDYQDLLRFEDGVPLCDKSGAQTSWISVSYQPTNRMELYSSLLEAYAYLKADGNVRLLEHLRVDRIDLCLFGNSMPFRIKILNRLNDNFDYFYVKKADASRIYGLELEHLLSPNRISFLLNQDTLIIEHIYGVPGDVFIEKYMKKDLNEVRLAKEFVKFNERCFLRLLGDMHASNFVVDITLDIEDSNYRIRAIDFDQQCYEGRKKVYLPQYYRENNPIINLGIKTLTDRSVKQYQQEERHLINTRMLTARYRLKNLFRVMIPEDLSPAEHVENVREELAHHYKNDNFGRCNTMGELVHTSLQTVAQH